MLNYCSPPLPEKPNIVLYIADDLSWWERACNGNELIKTPNVDLLAGDPQYAGVKEALKMELQQWMKEQGDFLMESELAVTLWERKNWLNRCQVTLIACLPWPFH